MGQNRAIIWMILSLLQGIPLGAPSDAAVFLDHQRHPQSARPLKPAASCTAIQSIHSGNTVRKSRTWRPDRFEHELMAVMREGEGLVVFTGCSHNGILNMIHTVQEQFAGVPIKVVLGGFT